MFTRAGYSATRDSDGTLTVHRVPIFVECERNEVAFDRDWISKAVVHAKQAESDGYLPPLHIRHHDAAAEMNDAVRAAGFFRVLGTELLSFKGEPREAVIADLIITDPQAQAEILAKRLPYRSVEIFDVTKPAFDGLALLDHEAPFLELPMLMVAEVREGDGDVTLTAHPTGMLAASFRRANHAKVLFRMGADMGCDPEKKSENMAEDEGGGGMNVGAIVKAIKKGSISIADFAAIKEAMAGVEGAGSEEPSKEEPTEAAVPGGEIMKAEKHDEKTGDTAGEQLRIHMARLQGEVDGLKAANQQLRDERLLDAEVADAMKKLDGRPLGSDVETRLRNFRREHGAKAFAAYVAEIERNVGTPPSSTDNGASFAGATSKVPAVAMKFAEQGVDAVERAAKFAREWEWLRGRGTSLSQEAYVANNMAKERLN